MDNEILCIIVFHVKIFLCFYLNLNMYLFVLGNLSLFYSCRATRIIFIFPEAIMAISDSMDDELNDEFAVGYLIPEVGE